MTLLRPFGWFFLLTLALSLVAAPALAEPGCYDGAGMCAPAVSLGPCDVTCPTGFCIGASCVDPETCAVPCGTMRECPALRLGNNLFLPESAEGEGCFYGTGCGGFTIDAGSVGTNDTTGRCLHAGDTGILAALRGDCDGDQVPLIAEGEGQHCLLETYVGPPLRTMPTCIAGMCGGDCVSGFSPHGGSVCASDGASGYACSRTAECPSTFDVPATGCIPYVTGTFRSGACFYGRACGDLGACFALARSDVPGARWLENAYLAGDCDMDGTPNGEDPSDCGPQLVRWTDTDPFVSTATRAGCRSSGGLCTTGVCSRLDVCAPGDSIGLACEPFNDAATGYCTNEYGVDAECVEAGNPGTDAPVGVCIPSAPADDSCGTRGRECFATDPSIDPADSYHRGDCDGDGLINGEDPDVCVPESEVDAGMMEQTDAASPPGVDAGNVTAADAGVADAARQAFDAATEGDAGEPGRFAGSGCSCRVHESSAASRAFAPFALLTAFGLALVGRRRRRAH
jgi:MYXO-CTERM domain-containing protein